MHLDALAVHLLNVGFRPLPQTTPKRLKVVEKENARVKNLKWLCIVAMPLPPIHPLPECLLNVADETHLRFWL